MHPMLALVLLLPPTVRGISEPYAARRGRLIALLHEKSGVLNPSTDLVIATHGDQFVVTAETRVPAQQTWPNEPNRYQVSWLLDWNSEAGPTAITLLRDDDLRRRWKNLPQSVQQGLIARTPELLRAGYTASAPSTTSPGETP